MRQFELLLRSRWLLLIAIATITACSTNNKSRTMKSVFGTLSDGTQIDQYDIKNINGISMSVITYGGIITSLKTPDRNGKLGDIVLGYDNLEGYVSNNPYFGAIIGRYGNRIAKGEFELNGEIYHLKKNNGVNHLHGGIKGFDKVVWAAEEIELPDGAGVKLTYTSPDGEEGYPGKLDVTVKYLLMDDNSLVFEYNAVTDKTTIVNLTNHSYYNLADTKDKILGHELLLNASQYLPVDSTLIPTGIDSVSSAFDFRVAKAVGRDIDSEDEQLKMGGGYDHCWVIDAKNDSLNFAASLYEPQSGRFMEVYTSEPGIQFYSGNFLDGTITGKENKIYVHRSGLCLETQHFPDSPNQPDFPEVVLNPGEQYFSKTVTKFSAK
ncbi:MAG: aldose epimerase family protein [Cyclobacteriaceae bacterium]